MSNPVFNENIQNTAEHTLVGEPCTVQGTINKTFLLFMVVFASFFMNFRFCMLNNLDTAVGLSWIGVIVGFILALIISFNPKTAPVLSPLYAFCEGLFLGAVSFMFEAQFRGIAIQAILATFGCLFVMLVLYSSKVITVTDKLRGTIFVATFGVAGIYLISWILSFFGIQVPAIHSSGSFGIAFSVIVCLIAGFNLLIDFDFIERASSNFLPKYFEWYGAFGLLVTIVWLYIEILRLLSKFAQRR